MLLYTDVIIIITYIPTIDSNPRHSRKEQISDNLFYFKTVGSSISLRIFDYINLLEK